MQFTTLIICGAAFFASVLANPIVAERDTAYCGSQTYVIGTYTCYGTFLCPITNGVIYQQCGPACFDPANYGCNNGQLHPVGVCNGQVYDKNTYVCVSNHLCPTGYPNLCGEACYSTSQYHCVRGKLVQN